MLSSNTQREIAGKKLNSMFRNMGRKTRIIVRRRVSKTVPAQGPSAATTDPISPINDQSRIPVLASAPAASLSQTPPEIRNSETIDEIPENCTSIESTSLGDSLRPITVSDGGMMQSTCKNRH
jgi:hypothetical protein